MTRSTNNQEQSGHDQETCGNWISATHGCTRQMTTGPVSELCQSPSKATPFAALSVMDETACGCDTYTAWLPLTSTTVEPPRLNIARWASGRIILSWVQRRY